MNLGACLMNRNKGRQLLLQDMKCLSSAGKAHLQVSHQISKEKEYLPLTSSLPKQPMLML